jgi:hypothetical protein
MLLVNMAEPEPIRKAIRALPICRELQGPQQGGQEVSDRSLSGCVSIMSWNRENFIFSVLSTLVAAFPLSIGKK